MKGTISTLTFKKRTIWVYLPPSYGNGQDRFPVVYVQDGQNLFDPQQSDSLSVLEEMFARAELEELMLVGIEPKERNDEYTPWPARALVDKFADFGGNGSAYLAFVVEELKPFVDAEFRTKTGSDQTGIIGASFGGLISMYAAYTHPAVFGRIGSLSGSYWYEGIIEYMKQEKFPEPHRRIYMYVGSAEGLQKPTIQKEMVSRSKQAFQLLLDSGCIPENIHLAIEEGGLHEWHYFTKRFPEALKWMFPIARL